MSTQPNSIVTPQNVVTATAVCTAAKSTYADNANAVRLLPAASNPNGSMVKHLTAMPRGTVAPTQLQLFRSPDQGQTLNLVDSTLMGAYTLSQTTAIPKSDFGYSAFTPLRVEPGEELWVGIGVALAAGVIFSVEYEAF
jgi:hypothetical protein